MRSALPLLCLSILLPASPCVKTPCTVDCIPSATEPRGNCCGGATTTCAFDTVFQAYRCLPVPPLICDDGRGAAWGRTAANTVASVVAPVAVTDPCTIRSDGVPCLHVRPCGGGSATHSSPPDPPPSSASSSASSASTAASFGPFHVTNANGTQPASQATRGTVCWDATGIHVHEHADEAHVFSPYTACNSPVFEKVRVECARK